jgi:hypothetical protein
MALSRALMALHRRSSIVPENGTMFLILRPGRRVVNRPTRGIFEQSALKIRANARKLSGSKGVKKY